MEHDNELDKVKCQNDYGFQLVCNFKIDRVNVDSGRLNDMVKHVNDRVSLWADHVSDFRFDLMQLDENRVFDRGGY